MGNRGKSSLDIKVNNIKKLIKRVKLGTISLKEAEINRRLDKLKAESAVGKIWAEDLHKDYINMVKTLNNY